MTVKEMTTKERPTGRIEKLNQTELEASEAQLDTITKLSPEGTKRRLTAWRGIFGLLFDPEEYAEFKKHARRHLLFGGRSLDLADKDRLIHSVQMFLLPSCVVTVR